MKKELLFAGLDVHAKEITVALAEGGSRTGPHLHGAIPNDMHAVEKLLARLRKAHPSSPI